MTDSEFDAAIIHAVFKHAKANPDAPDTGIELNNQNLVADLIQVFKDAGWSKS